VSHDVTHVGDKTDADLDEDLFDFAAVAREAEAIEPEEDLEEIFASFRDGEPAEDLLAVPPAPAAPAPASQHATRVAPSSAPEPKSPPRPVPAAKLAPEARASEPVHALVPAARPSHLSKGVVAIALSVTALNSVLAVVVLRGRTAEGELPRTETHAEAERHAPLALAAPPHRTGTSLPDPEAVDPAHAHPALDEARAEIARGEYASARQRVYRLLAIIDRLEDPRRGALEADCQFLIAQSLHLEALARMGGT